MRKQDEIDMVVGAYAWGLLAKHGYVEAYERADLKRAEREWKALAADFKPTRAAVEFCIEMLIQGGMERDQASRCVPALLRMAVNDEVNSIWAEIPLDDLLALLPQ